ncbi:hypothetical protein OO17_15770 [Rhodopseudomonas palustris]|uniref:Uncharacterized protein n=1 Tax=Rhodopseudomonas palustris TaxID=1076 RepID=A0A0D7EL04_RHOPL|nr:hypothetical protein OO17_15770 [Rhodopseudomonas palustris]
MLVEHAEIAGVKPAAGASGPLTPSAFQVQHGSHFSVSDALSWIDRFKPKRAVITNMHADIDYEVLRRQLPVGVVPGFDGMRLVVG